jgi:hypothetical protein
MTDDVNDGDVVLCVECGEFAEVEDGRLAIPSDETYDDLNSDPKIQRVKEAWMQQRGSLRQ